MQLFTNSSASQQSCPCRWLWGAARALGQLLSCCPCAKALVRAVKAQCPQLRASLALPSALPCWSLSSGYSCSEPAPFEGLRAAASEWFNCFCPKTVGEGLGSHWCCCCQAMHHPQHAEDQHQRSGQRKWADTGQGPAADPEGTVRRIKPSLADVSVWLFNQQTGATKPTDRVPHHAAGS